VKQEVNSKTWKEYAALIADSWRASVDGILLTARQCAEASRFTGTERMLLLSELPFKRATFSKLVCIGKDERLYEEAIRCFLPPRYSILYLLTLLDNITLQRAVVQGILHSEVQRSDIEALRPRKEVFVPYLLPNKPSSETVPSGHQHMDNSVKDAVPTVAPSLKQPTSAPTILGEFRLPADYPPQRLLELKEQVRLIEKEFGATFVDWQEPPFLALNRRGSEYERCLAIGRVLARQRLLALYRACTTAGTQPGAWGFTDEETDIGACSAWHDVYRVLICVGLEDEFERIQSQAAFLAGMEPGAEAAAASSASPEALPS
jgi:hypothetical protein